MSASDAAGALDLLDLRLSGFLEGLALDAPIPAGGSAMAMAAAMAASLVRMVARSSPNWSEAAGVEAQAHALAERVAPLALADAEAYAEVLAMRRLPADDLSQSQRDHVLGDALARAAEIPLAIAAAAADIAELAALAAQRGEGHVRGDAVVAAVLAEGACAAAAALVDLNLTSEAGRGRAARARAAASAARTARALALGDT